MGRIDWERTASMLFCLVLLCGALLLGVRYLAPILIPFLIAWAISLLVRPLAQRIAVRWGVPHRLCAALLLMLLLCGAFALLWFSGRRLFLELGSLVERFLNSEDMTAPTDYFAWLTERLGLFRSLAAQERLAAFREQFNQTVSEMMGSLLNSLSSELPRIAGALIAALPDLLLGIFVTVIAAFCFCLSKKAPTERVIAVLPSALRARLPRWKEGLRRLSWRYLRVYLLLLLFTFSVLFLGFCILRVKYAFLLALLVALVDLLPILGVGTVLVPWAIVALLRHDLYLGIGLLILYAAVLILRQVLEPNLLGKSLGLSPLMALFATYAGWRLFGFWGMLLGPIVATLCKTVFQNVKKTS